MKLLKNALRCCILFFSYGIHSESVDTLPSPIVSVDATQDEPVIKKVLTEDPVEVPLEPLQDITNTSTEQPQEEKTEEKNSLSGWLDHLKSLLVQGAFWDSAASIPTQAWQDEAYSLAKQALTHDISVASELKSSFLDTMNNKLTSIEKSSNLKEFPALINNFNTTIDEFVQELQASREQKITEDVTVKTNTDTEKADQQEIADQNFPNQEETILAETETSENLEEQKNKAKQERQKEKWQDALENVRTEGVSQEEVDSILDSVQEIARKRVDRVDENLKMSELQQLKADLSDALEVRSITGSKDLHRINSATALKHFEQAITAAFGNTDNNTIFGNPVSTAQNDMNEYGMQPENIYPPQQAPNESITKKDITPEKTQNDYLERQKRALEEQRMAEQIRLQGVEFERVNAERNKEQVLLERKRQQQVLEKEREALLKRNIQLAAMQKTSAEKEAAQKGILSSIAESVLGDWWKTPKASEKIMKSESIKKENALKATISKLTDPVTQELLDENTQEVIRVAYYKFEEILLAFNSKEFWNSANSIDQQPNKEWIKKIQKPLAILVKYKMITIENALTIVHDTLEAKMIGATLKTLEDGIRSYLQKVELKETQRILAAQREAEKEKQEKAQAKQQEMARREEEIRLQQEALVQQQQEELRRIEQRETIKMTSLKEIQHLQASWNNLLRTIAHEKSATAIQNDSWATQALNSTKQLLTLASNAELPSSEMKNIITKHKADFAKALLEQQKGNEPGLNLQPIMERFNKEVHE